MSTELRYVDVDEAIKAAVRTLNDGYRVIHGRDCTCTYCEASEQDRRCTQLCFGCFADCPTNPFGAQRVLTRGHYREQQVLKETPKYKRELFWRKIRARLRGTCIVTCPSCEGTLETRHGENCGYTQSDQMLFEQDWRAHERGDCKKCRLRG